MGSGPLYLSHHDVLACGLSPAEIIREVGAGFAAAANGRAASASRLSLPVDQRTSFSAKGGMLLSPDEEASEGCAAVKWYGYVPHNAARGIPDFSPAVILSDVRDGSTLALLDGHWLSAARTAAISCLAATRLANPAASSIGFIACGTLAQAHLHLLAASFPLRRIVAQSRTRASAQRLAERARVLGLDATVADDAHDALRSVDIVVTSIPREASGAGLLDTNLLPEGAFVAMPCMGRSWRADAMHRFDYLCTDELDPLTSAPREPIEHRGPFDADLPRLLSGASAPVWAPNERRGIVFAGSGLADVALAAALYRRAQARGLGARLAPPPPRDAIFPGDPA